jgi:SAM-dependent methyltransferase
VDAQRDLRAYYEEEARLRRRGPLRGPRLALRSEFIELLGDEGRTSVLDLGAGPGRDGEAFVAAGMRFVGLDLAVGNAAVAASVGVTVIPGSIAAPPLRTATFDAGWSMSTLMHVPTADVPTVLAAMLGPLRPGAPVMVGQWGGDQGDAVINRDIEGQRRLFCHRPLATNRSLLAAHGAVEAEIVWHHAPERHEYHVFRLRTPA